MGLENKRTYTRVRVSIPLEIKDPESAAPGIGRFVDFSAGGGCVMTNKIFYVGAKVKVSFEVDGEKYIEIQATVVRSKQNPEFCSLGLRFENLTPIMSERFDRLVRRSHSLKERGMSKGHI